MNTSNFIAGVLAIALFEGALAGFKAVKKRYFGKKEAEEADDEYFCDENEADEDQNEEESATEAPEETEKEEPMTEMVRHIAEGGYFVDEVQVEKTENGGFRTMNTPRVVNESIFFNQFLFFDKVGLTYFENNDILIDDQDEEIRDRQALIGDALMFFGEGTDDPDTVFVLNEGTETKYEITRVHGFFTPDM